MIRLLAALLCLLLAVFNPVAAQTTPYPPDAYEVDNSNADAKPLTFSLVPQQHDFHERGDSDRMTFTLPPGGSAVITFAPTTAQWSDSWRADLYEVVLGISFYRGQQTFGTMLDGTTARTLTASNSFPVTSTFYVRVGVNTSVANSFTFVGARSRYTVRATSASGGNLPPYVSLTGPGNNSSHPLGNAINLTATASDPDGTIDHVEFLINGQEVGRSPQAPFSYQWTPTAVGTYTYSARAVDNGGASTTSPTQTVVVRVGAQPPVVTLEPIGGPFLPGQPITLRATATDAGGITRVDFIANGSVLNSDYDWPYEYVWPNAPIGTHTVAAQAFNINYLSSTSAPQQVVVTGPNQAPTVSLTVTPAGSTFPLGQSFTLQATASDVDGVPQWVEFFANGTSLVKDYTSPYSHVWTPTLTGTYTLQARTMDDDGAPATSSSVTITITAASNQPPTVSLTAPTAGSVHTIGQTVTVKATASDPENSLNRVEFLENGNIVQTISGAGPYNFAWIPANVGARVLQARAVDNGSPQLSTLSDSVSVTVNAPGGGSNPPTPPAPAAYTPPSPASMAGSDAVGATTGSFRVSESGDANYSIPFYTAPSAGGTGPQMALSYSSSSAFGAAGAGWSIQGASAISRCRQTVEHGDIADSLGEQLPVTLTTSDRYCLDGQRLVAVTRNTAGVCAAASAEYRTEIDSYRTVCGYTESGNASGGHAYFAVYGKDGTVSVYGRDQWSPSQGGAGAGDYASRLMANVGGTPRAAISWAISRFEDTTGNYFDYVYSKDEVNGEQYLAEVRYNANRTAGQTPNQKLRFNYTALAANEWEQGRVATATTRQAKVLASVDSLGVSDQWLRHYKLRYSSPVLGERRNLLGLTECASSVAGAVCYPETQFNWTASGVNFTGSSTGTSSGAVNGFEGLAAEKFGDVNGDGLTDIVWLKRANSSEPDSDIAEFWITTTVIKNGVPVPGDGAALRFYTGLPFAANQSNAQRSWHLLDYDGDGRDDLLRLVQAGRTTRWIVHLATPISPGSTVYNFTSSGIVLDIYAADGADTMAMSDFTGDGLPDLLIAGAGDTGSSLNLRLFPMQRSSSATLPYQYSLEIPVVLNTNGILFPSDNLGDQTSLRWSFSQNQRSLNKFQPMDIDADGRSDLSAVLYTNYIQGALCTPQGTDGAAARFMTDPEAATQDAASRGSGSTSPLCYVPYPTVMRAKGLNASGQFEFVPYGPRLGQGCFVAHNGAVTGTIDNGSIQYGDFSGDGYADVLFKQFNPSQRTSCNVDQEPADTFAFRVNRGDGFGVNEADTIPATVIGGLDPESNNDTQDGELQFLDVNGDARADLVYPRYFGAAPDDPRNRYRVRYWDGSTFETAQEFPGTNLGTSFFPAARGDKSWRGYLIDLDNDGWVEGLRVKPVCASTPCTTWQVMPSINIGRPQQRIESIITGLGAATVLKYAPLSDSSVYSRATNTAALPAMGRGSPVFDLYGPLYVVKQAESSAPTETNPSAMAGIRYFYVGGRIQGGGRGFLGFAELHTYADVLQASAPSQRMRTITRNRQDFPFVGMPEETVQELVTVNSAGLSTGVVRQLSRGSSSYYPRAIPSSPQPISVLTQMEEAYAYDLQSGGQLSASRTQYTSYDAYGSVLTMSVADLNASGSAIRTAITTNTYGANNINRWFLGRLTQTSVSHWVSGMATETRTSQFEYDAATGLLNGEITEPNGPVDQSLRKAYELDVYGNRTRSATCSNAHFTSRTACLDASSASFKNHWGTTTQQQYVKRIGRVGYDSRGRYATTSYVWANNGELPQERASQWTAETDFDRFGNPMRTSSANGSIAQAQYGALGREHARWSNDGAATETRYAWCGTVSCPANMRYRTEVRAIGGATSWSYHDILGRARYSVSEGYSDTSDPEAALLGFSSNQYIAKQSHYDVLGRVVRSSEPYFAQGPSSSSPQALAAGAALYWTSTTFDALGRATRVDLPETGAYAETSYQGLNTVSSTRACANTSLCPLQTRTETKNYLGQLVSTIDANGVSVWNFYDTQSHLVRVEQGRGAANPALTITVGYNKVGFKTSMIDPDKGNWSYTVNALGEVVDQTDAKGQHIKNHYDAQGRVWQRTDLRANGTTESIASFEFDTASYGLGGLASESISAGTFSKTYSYDSLGRSRSVVTQLDGAGYTVLTTYDQYGRTYWTQDASGDAILSEYTQRGFIKRQKEVAGSASGQVLNEVRAINARGQVTEERRGGQASLTTYRDYWPQTGRLKSIIASGGSIQNLYYEWDWLGNLTRRWDRSGGADMEESFDYDVLNRLTTVRLTRRAGGPVVNNQITQSLSYSDSGNIQSKTGVGSYTYGQTSCGPAGPHAVTNAGGVDYCYDANGNQWASSTGRNLSYSVFDKPLTITVPGETVSFSYGTGRELVKRVDNNGADSTRFVGGVEVLVNENATRRSAAGTIVKTQGGTRTLSYVYTDHLGSISAIVAANGSISQRQSFDAHGSRREPSNWQEWSAVQQVLFNTSLTRQSFTGHEGVDKVGLIHFGGRMYDPRLGRFIQADPLVEDANQADGLNRYTYVMNNPLTLTDPTGYLTWSEARPVVAIVVSIVLQNYAQGLVGIQALMAQTAIGATSGAIAGGSRGAVMGAFSAALFYGIGSSFEQAGFMNDLSSSSGQYNGAFGTNLTGAQFAQKVALHGLAGGVMSELGGGKFGHGFASAAGTELASAKITMIGGGAREYKAHRVFSAALVGGTIAQATGGKFANGALTAAFSRTFNGEWHLERRVDQMNADGLGISLDEFDKLTGRSGSRQAAEVVTGAALGTYQLGRGVYRFYSFTLSWYASIGEGYYTGDWTMSDYRSRQIDVVGKTVEYAIEHPDQARRGAEAAARYIFSDVSRGSATITRAAVGTALSPLGTMAMVGDGLWATEQAMHYNSVMSHVVFGDSDDSSR